MVERIPFRPGSDQYDELVSGLVLANRINDVVAKPDTQRYRDYLNLVAEQRVGEPVVDESEPYRERARVLHKRALGAYEYRHGVKVETDVLYKLDGLGAVPDGVDGLIGLDVQVKHEFADWDGQSVIDPNAAQMRTAWAMMAVTGLQYWLLLTYHEDAENRKRNLLEQEIVFDPIRAKELQDAMVAFSKKASRRAAA